MKTVFHLAVLVATTVAFIGMTREQASAAASYPLVCRGGGTMSLDIWHNIQDAAWLLVKFNVSGQPANTAPPKPGECAWLDRGVSPGEPPYFAVKFGSVTIVPTMQAGGGVEGTTVYSQSGDSGASQRKRQAEELIRAIRGGMPFQVHAALGVFPIGNRQVLMVSRVGP